MKRLSALVTTVVASTLFCGSAIADIIDFEEYSQTSGNTPSTQGDVTSMGFLFDSLTNHTHFVNNFGGGDSGSTYFGADDFAGANAVTMSLIGGGSFSLLSMDLGNWFERSTSLQIVGNFAGGGSIGTTIALGAFSSYNFGWTGLSSIRFDSLAGAGDQYWGVDNISVRVPEPGTLALLGIGLLGMGLARRTKV